MKIKVVHDQLLAMNSALSGTQLAALVLVKLLEDYDSISQSLRHSCQVQYSTKKYGTNWYLKIGTIRYEKNMFF